MPETSTALIYSALLFRFGVPCHHTRQKWKPTQGITLGEKYRLPCFAELEPSDSLRAPLLGEVRMAWNRNGLFFSLEVRGKKRPPVRSFTTSEMSDGITLCIDTRDTHNVHRATRFCHQFRFLPASAVHEAEGRSLLIAGAKEPPQAHDPQLRDVYSEDRPDGYLLQAAIPASVLTGFDPDEHPRLGFTYLIRDRESGVQPFAVGTDMPILRDPSFWSTLELME